ncbi:MAG: hypothetical protein EP344_05595 [Bacteroidetes bacterium]|nr:MAG: hypothetical protein EP344_05595 [Bacteroidota bacterium]
MTEAIIKGALAGLAYGMLLGPLFFMSLQVTLQRGLANGLSLAAGAFFSDALLAVGGWWSSGQLLALARQPLFQSAMGTVGALLIISFGISAVVPRNLEASGRFLGGLAARRRFSFAKGFALNMANPSNWLFWLGLATAVRAEAPDHIEGYTIWFLATTIFMVFSTDMAKVLLARKVGQVLRPGLPGKIVRVAGLVLILIGVSVLVQLHFMAE